MDNLEYLNHISQTSKPTKRSSKIPDRKTSLLIKFSVAGVVVFFLLMALGSLFGNLNNKATDLTKQIYVRTTNLDSALKTYNNSLKSSKLRAIGVSLSSILANASRQLSDYLTTNNKDKNALLLDDKTAASEAALIEELNASLTNAKLNGVLDRYYDGQISLQVSLLLAQTSQLLTRTKDADLINIVTNLRTSLEAIDQSLKAYSNN